MMVDLISGAETWSFVIALQGEKQLGKENGGLSDLI